MNLNKFRFIKSEWYIDEHKTEIRYHAIDIETQQMIPIAQHVYEKGMGIALEDRTLLNYKEIIKDYKSDMRIVDLLDKHGISDYKLRSILRAKQVEYRKPSRPNIYDIDMTELLKDFKAGKTNPELAEKYDASYNIIAWSKYIFKKKGYLD